MLRKFCIINTCGSEDCGNQQQDHEHGAYYLVQDVDPMLERFHAAADLHAQILADKNASIAQLEREVAAITAQRDRVWSQLLDAREQIQRLTFGKH